MLSFCCVWGQRASWRYVSRIARKMSQLPVMLGQKGRVRRPFLPHKAEMKPVTSVSRRPIHLSVHLSATYKKKKTRICQRGRKPAGDEDVASWTREMRAKVGGEEEAIIEIRGASCPSIHRNAVLLTHCFNAGKMGEGHHIVPEGKRNKAAGHCDVKFETKFGQWLRTWPQQEGREMLLCHLRRCG